MQSCSASKSGYMKLKLFNLDALLESEGDVSE